MRLKTAFMLLFMVLAGCVSAPAPTATPVPSSTPTPVASSTPTAQPTITPTAEASVITPTLAETLTPIPTVATVVPVIQTDLIAPIYIEIPPDWLVGNGALPLQEGIGVDMGFVPFSVYSGPVTGGEATITLLWGFTNAAPVASLSGGAPQIDLWMDGLRLLYLVILEGGCTIGRDERRTFTVAGREAIGGYFAAQNCPELFDTRGWFVVTQEEGINFAFYVYTNPMTALDGAARQELQAILDSVVFDMSLLPPPTTPEAGE